jgi:hypothetical protein
MNHGEHEAQAKMRIDKRRGLLAEQWKALLEGWRKKLEAAKSQPPVHPAWITHNASRSLTSFVRFKIKRKLGLQPSWPINLFGWFSAACCVRTILEFS